MLAFAIARLVKDWGEADKQRLVSQLAAHLSKNLEHLRAVSGKPVSLASLTWIPVQLLLKGLLSSVLEQKLFPPTSKYDPHPRGVVGAKKNWEALQVMRQTQFVPTTL